MRQPGQSDERGWLDGQQRQSRLRQASMDSSRMGSRPRGRSVEFELPRRDGEEIPSGQPHPEPRGGPINEPEAQQTQGEQPPPSGQAGIRQLRAYIRDTEISLGPMSEEVTKGKAKLQALIEKNERDKPPEDKLQSIKDKIRHQEEKEHAARTFFDQKDDYLNRVKAERDDALKELEEARVELKTLKIKRKEVLEEISRGSRAGSQQPPTGTEDPPLDILTRNGIDPKTLGTDLARSAAHECEQFLGRLRGQMLELQRMQEQANMAKQAKEADGDEKMPNADRQTKARGVRSDGGKEAPRRATGSTADPTTVATPATSTVATPTTTPRARKALQQVEDAEGSMATKTRRGDENGGVLVAPALTNEGSGAVVNGTCCS